MRVFENLYHENNRKETLKEGQLSLRYLIDVFEQYHGNLSPTFRPDKESMYVKRVSEIMISMNQNQD